MGVVIVIVQSELAVFKDITFDALVSKFTEVVSSVAYRTWSPNYFMNLNRIRRRDSLPWFAFLGFNSIPSIAKYFTFNLIGVALACAVMTTANSTDLFQNCLQFLASKVTLADFFEVKWISHSWDENCNVVHVKEFGFINQRMKAKFC